MSRQSHCKDRMSCCVSIIEPAVYVILLGAFLSKISTNFASLGAFSGFGSAPAAFFCFFFSYAWVIVNKGSSFWQKNWERHIDVLEGQRTLLAEHLFVEAVPAEPVETTANGGD